MNTNIFRPCPSRLARTLVLAGTAAIALPALAQSNTTIKVESSCTVSQDANGHKTVISYRNGHVDHAQVDGKDVPMNRIHHNGDRLTIVDEHGNTVYAGLVPGAAGATFGLTPSWPTMPPPASSFAPPPAPNFGPNPMMNQAPAVQAPKSMVGLELVRPDPALLGHFGLKPGDATEVWAVSEGLPGSAAGLSAYDLIVGVNGQSPADPSTVKSALSQAEPGKPITLSIIHQGKRQTVTITPAAYDRDKLENARPASIAAGSPMIGMMGMNTGPTMHGWFGPGAGATSGMPGMGVTVSPFSSGLANPMDPAFAQALRDAMERLDQQFVFPLDPNTLRMSTQDPMQMMQQHMQQMRQFWQNQQGPGGGMNGWIQPQNQPAPQPPAPQPKPTTQA